MFISQKGIIAFGSSTPSPLFLNQGDVVIGRNGSTNDLYVSGGLGVGNATTTDNDFVVGLYRFSVFASDRIGMLGTSSPALDTALNIGSDTAGTNAHLYVSGGLGVANATSSTGDFVIGDDFYFYNNGRFGIGTSTPDGPKATFTASTTEAHFFSSATSTLKIYSSNNVQSGQGGCIEMEDSVGTIYRIYITHGSTTATNAGLGIEQGSCT